jgi:hypothetical protein
MITRILIGLVITVIGFLIAYKFEAMFRAFGRIAWVEKYLGIGQSRFYYQALGFLIAIIGLMVMTNLFERIALAILLPIFRI